MMPPGTVTTGNSPMSELTESQLEQVANRWLADYDNATPGALFAEGFRPGARDAWRLQTAVSRLREARGETVIGYKIGCVSPGNQQMMGLTHPVWGRIWDSESYSSGVRLQKSRYANLALEAEFGVTLNRDIKPDTPAAAIADAIDAVYPVLELHNLSLRGAAPHGHELIASNCIHSGVVKGAAVRYLDVADSHTELRLVYDGVVVDSWQRLDWRADMFSAVAWLATRLGSQRITLNAGQLLLTGAWGPPIAVEHCSAASACSSAFGDVGARFD